MPPAVYLALLLLFFPTVILAEPIHVPITLLRRSALIDWNAVADKLRIRYNYSPISSLSKKRAVSGQQVFDQVEHYYYYFVLYQLIAGIESRF